MYPFWVGILRRYMHFPTYFPPEFLCMQSTLRLLALVEPQEVWIPESLCGEELQVNQEHLH